RAAMLQIAHQLERVLDQPMRFSVLDIGDESDATGILVEGRVIQPLRWRKAGIEPRLRAPILDDRLHLGTAPNASRAARAHRRPLPHLLPVKAWRSVPVRRAGRKVRRGATAKSPERPAFGRFRPDQSGPCSWAPADNEMPGRRSVPRTGENLRSAR